MCCGRIKNMIYIIQPQEDFHGNYLMFIKKNYH